MVDTILHLSGTTQEKMQFIDDIENGKAVNCTSLLKTASTFSDIFSTTLAEEFFIKLANYGRGNKLKGPGEFALAIMSPEINLAKKGDIEVNGESVEVKAAVNKAGGRMGEVGDAARKEEIITALTNIGRKYLTDEEDIELLHELFLDKKSLAIKQAAKNAHTVFDNDKAIKEFISGPIALTFNKEIGDAVGTAAVKDPTGNMAELAYMKENFKWYKQKDGFDSILAIWFGGRKTYSFSTAEELISLRSSGLFTGAGISFIPSKENELFAQLNFGGRPAIDTDTISTPPKKQKATAVDTTANDTGSEPPKNKFGRDKR